MALSPELVGRLNHPMHRDRAMLEAVDLYIADRTIDPVEFTNLVIDRVPFANHLPEILGAEVLDRIVVANELMIMIRESVGNLLKQAGVPGEFGLDALNYFRQISLESRDCALVLNSAVYYLLTEVEERAAEWNMPARELRAAIARVGVESCVNILLNSQDLEQRRLAKGSLLYFSGIEMLAIGCRTNSNLFCMAQPELVDPAILSDYEIVMPAMLIEGDTKLQGALAMGMIEIEKKVDTGTPGVYILTSKGLSD